MCKRTKRNSFFVQLDLLGTVTLNSGCPANDSRSCTANSCWRICCLLWDLTDGFPANFQNVEDYRTKYTKNPMRNLLNSYIYWLLGLLQRHMPVYSYMHIYTGSYKPPRVSVKFHQNAANSRATCGFGLDFCSQWKKRRRRKAWEFLLQTFFAVSACYCEI